MPQRSFSTGKTGYKDISKKKCRHGRNDRNGRDIAKGGAGEGGCPNQIMSAHSEAILFN